MTFENLHIGTDCNCLHRAKPNSTDLFARRVGKAPDLKDRDFRTHHERSKEPDDPDNCSIVCGYRGLSVDLWNDDTKEQILNRYGITNAFAPVIGKKKNQLSIIRLNEASGVVKHTPIKGPSPNPYHYDWYKCDNFDLTLVELVDLIPL